MFIQSDFRFWETFGYESDKSFEPEAIEGIFIKIIDPSGKADEHLLEDFMKSSIITDIPPGKEDNDHWINVKQSYPLFSVIQVDKKPEGNKVFLKPNPYDIQQQIYAIKSLQEKPRKEHRPLLKLFESKQKTTWTAFTVEKITDWFLLRDYPGVESQKQFVEIARSTPDFAILEGPPGSGKTVTICELILQSIKRGERVLLCASTHVAVDNVLEKLMHHPDVIAVRIGNENSDLILPQVKDFLLSRRKTTERKRLIQKLLELGPTRNSGQEYYLNILQSV